MPYEQYATAAQNRNEDKNDDDVKSIIKFLYNAKGTSFIVLTFRI